MKKLLKVVSIATMLVLFSVYSYAKEEFVLSKDYRDFGAGRMIHLKADYTEWQNDGSLVIHCHAGHTREQMSFYKGYFMWVELNYLDPDDRRDLNKAGRTIRMFKRVGEYKEQGDKMYGERFTFTIREAWKLIDEEVFVGMFYRESHLPDPDEKSPYPSYVITHKRKIGDYGCGYADRDYEDTLRIKLEKARAFKEECARRKNNRTNFSITLENNSFAGSWEAGTFTQTFTSDATVSSTYPKERSFLIKGYWKTPFENEVDKHALGEYSVILPENATKFRITIEIPQREIMKWVQHKGTTPLFVSTLYFYIKETMSSSELDMKAEWGYCNQAIETKPSVKIEIR